MTILIFGKSGQLGSKLSEALSQQNHIIALDRLSRDFCGDLADPQGLIATIEKIKPSIIVNAAAYTAVDRAEDEPELANAINGHAPAIMAQAAKACGALLIHYSSDYVFDGSGTKPWTETDIAIPVNAYGRSKLAGDNAIEISGCNYNIFRTSWVFSSHGKNFLRSILALATTREELKIVADQTGSPTSVDLLVKATQHAIAQYRAGKNCNGIYHLAAAGETSWFSYAEFFIDTARHHGLAITVKRIMPLATRDFPAKAQRPLNSRLNTQKFEKMFSMSLPPWQQDVEQATIAIVTSVKF